LPVAGRRVAQPSTAAGRKGHHRHHGEGSAAMPHKVRVHSTIISVFPIAYDTESPR
jgi:hypothetical protein